MLKKLEQVLQQEDTVLFIGSGISLWSGLPSWGGLIKELAAFMNQEGQDPKLVLDELQRGDLLQAASYGFDKLTVSQIGTFIRQSCKYGSAKPHEIHEKIVKLGPTCFVTTNYDNLIELSLAKWQPELVYRGSVSNRQLAEMADVVHAKARNYVFKPHGDAGDVQSIVLTREQYRRLLPQGGIHSALECLKTIMTTRPVVYLGFGLRDPDFLYLRDILANTYNGGVRDHYAIMPDIGDSESDYWRRNYGIHLYNYATSIDEYGKADHSSLLYLLDTLSTSGKEKLEAPAFDKTSPTVILALARYSAGLIKPDIEEAFEIKVSPIKGGLTKSRYKDDEVPVLTFLAQKSIRVILTGLPGAGKSFSLKQATSLSAVELSKACLSFSDAELLDIPMFGDFKFYNGSIIQLLENNLPTDLPFKDVLSNFKVSIFLDSFNEMPKEYWETGYYEQDLEAFVKTYPNVKLVIGSRTADGLNKLELPAYSMDHIDTRIVYSRLNLSKDFFLGGFGHELLALLKRPFFFQYILSGRLAIPANGHPRDFYKAFFDDINESFKTEYSAWLDWQGVLSVLAFDTLNYGEETFKLSVALNAIEHAKGALPIESAEIVNWLISKNVLVPYQGKKLAFIHQSITEYLAALELARAYQKDENVLLVKMQLIRWDQALFLTLSLLSEVQAKTFLSTILDLDLMLAINAAKYMEFGSEAVVEEILIKILNLPVDAEDLWKIGSDITRNLPITSRHIPLLLDLVWSESDLAADAAERIIAIKGDEVKMQIIDVVFQKEDIENFAHEVGNVLSEYAQMQDIEVCISRLEHLRLTVSDDEDRFSSCTDFCNAFLGHMDITIIKERLFAECSQFTNRDRIAVCAGMLWMNDSLQTPKVAAELLLLGADVGSQISSMEDNEKFKDKALWNCFTEMHIIKLINDGAVGLGPDTLAAIATICKMNPLLKEKVKEESLKYSVIEQLVLKLYAGIDQSKGITEFMFSLIDMSKSERDLCPLELLQGLQFDWKGYEECFDKLLTLRDERVALAIMERTIPVKVKNLLMTDVELLPMLAWMENLRKGRETNFLCGQIGSVIGSLSSERLTKDVVREFNDPLSSYRFLILDMILPFQPLLTIKDFSEETLAFLIEDLALRTVSSFRGILLGEIADEQFLKERLFSLLDSDNELLQKNVLSVIARVGKRFGKRFLFKNGEPLTVDNA